MEMKANNTSSNSHNAQRRATCNGVERPFWFLESLDCEFSEHNSDSEEKEVPVQTASGQCVSSTNAQVSITGEGKGKSELEHPCYNFDKVHLQNKDLRRHKQHLLDSKISSKEAKGIFDVLQANEKTFCASKRRNWTMEETKLLFFAVSNYAMKKNISDMELEKEAFECISKLIPGRSPTQCDYKWSMIRLPKSKKEAWTAEETTILKNLVEKATRPSWKNVAADFNYEMKGGQKRTSKQCRERWLNNINSQVVRACWTPEEDYEIVVGVVNKGKRWASIKRRIRGRTEMGIKNRYYTLLRNHSKVLQVHQTELPKNIVYENAFISMHNVGEEGEEVKILQSLHAKMTTGKEVRSTNPEMLEERSETPKIVCEIAQIQTINPQRKSQSKATSDDSSVIILCMEDSEDEYNMEG